VSTALVVGLGRSGRSAAQLLVRHGWGVIATDAQAADADDLIALGVDVRAPWTDPIDGVDLLVKSPGVSGEIALVAVARAAGVEVISEIELAARYLPNPMIGITGTNGKTTTTELVAHLLDVGGHPAIACGNQGLPVTELVDEVDPETWLVVECSSFQLEDIVRFHPRAAVLLNISPDHLDRHGSMERYGAAKATLFRNLDTSDLAIAPEGFPVPGSARPRTIREGERTSKTDIAWSGGGLHVEGLGKVIAWNEVPLRGRHNRQNVMAASAVVHALIGATAVQIAEGLKGFTGVPHRLEVVGEHDGVTYINDSKATNVDSALAALDAYPARVRLIAGGSSKGAAFAPLAAAARGGVLCAYLIGQTAEEIAAAFAAESVPVVVAANLERAIDLASHDALPGDVILLAPACASFDQFANFEDRGDQFRALVARRLKGSLV